jgi:hypothetical protein
MAIQRSEETEGTHIVVLVLWEQSVVLLQKDDELLGHDIQLPHERVGIDVAIAGADGVVDKQDVGEFVPGAVVVLERLIVLYSIGANLHHGAIEGAASRAAIQPNHGPLLVRNVFVLEMPKEEVAVAFGGDFDVPGAVKSAWFGLCFVRLEMEHVPSMHLHKRLRGRARKGVDEVVGGRLIGCRRCGRPWEGEGGDDGRQSPPACR